MSQCSLSLYCFTLKIVGPLITSMETIWEWPRFMSLVYFSAHLNCYIAAIQMKSSSRDIYFHMPS